MNREINIAETEWQVMEILWKTPGATIGEIREGLSDTGWSDSTIKTLVRRLVQKGALKANSDAGQFQYVPQVSAEECRLRETKHLIDRVYHGSVKMLMAGLAADSELTEAETKKLMEIIDKIEEGS